MAATAQQPHSAFEHVESRPIEALNLTVECYRHRRTGARHYHLAADDSNNAFLVAFLTMPQDSTGVAHILEHTSLCGSQRYPVRDPFFMMIRRSLNTFMNAFTSSDWTAYPFASQTPKDFNNLLEVYLDAAFFPRLERLDFAQEGHRIELRDPEDLTSPLEYKGVVFNEMKGAMSSPLQTLWQTLQTELFPTVTYHHNSGGDPAHIPELTYQALKDFHARHYHPSNAIFMTYGDIPPAAHQERFESFALQHFGPQAIDFHVAPEQRYTEPRRVTDYYALDGEEDTQARTHIVMGWLLGDITEPLNQLEAQLLAQVLIDHSASPLRQALEITELGSAPAEVMGMDHSMREMVFACGLEGSEPERTEAVEALILDTLREVAANGVPQAQVEAVLQQLELAQREVGGGSFPYGLELMVNALGPAIHGGDPAAALDIDPVLKTLRERIADPDYIPRLIRQWLLDNPHRVTLTLVPDTELSARRQAAEQDRLVALKAELSQADLEQVRADAAALEAKQMQEDDPEVLPKVTLADVPAEITYPEPRMAEVAGRPVHCYSQGTNGLVYLQTITELPALDAETAHYLPLFCACLTEVGAGEADYLQMQSRQAATTGGLHAQISLRGAAEDVGRARAFFVLGGKALARYHESMAELLHQTFWQARFDELPRLRELIAQMRAAAVTQVTGRGHVLAMSAAAARLGPASNLAHDWHGLAGIRRLKQLDDALDDEAELERLAAAFGRIRQALMAAPRQYLVVAEAQHTEALLADLERLWGQADNAAADFQPFAMPTPAGAVREAWTTSSQVNFAAKAYPTVAASHADAPALQVLAVLLRNNYLHRAIREQGGAYGGGANWDSDSGGFRFFSYRDPRLEGTLHDFDAAIDWLMAGGHEYRLLEESILGVISAIDRPESPVGEAVRDCFARLHGRSPAWRRDFRQRVLEVSLADVQRVAETYLRPERANVAVLGGPATLQAKHAELDLELQPL